LVVAFTLTHSICCRCSYINCHKYLQRSVGFSNTDHLHGSETTRSSNYHHWWNSEIVSRQATLDIVKINTSEQHFRMNVII